jgi:DNA-binding MarR family transcriptional regulator
METSARAPTRERGRRRLRPEDLLIEHPYSSVLKMMRAAGGCVTIAWLKSQGVRSARQPYRTLEKPSLSKVMKRLVLAGLVEKDKHKFRLTLGLTKLKARAALEDRIMGTDFELAGQNVLVWGRLGQYTQFREGLARKLESMSKALGKLTCIMAVSQVEERLRAYVNDDNNNPRRKACALMAVKDQLDQEQEIFGWGGRELKKLGIADSVKRITEDDGLALITSRTRRREVRRVMKKLNKGEGRSHWRRIQDQVYRKEFDRIFKILDNSESPLVVIRGRIPEGRTDGEGRGRHA